MLGLIDVGARGFDKPVELTISYRNAEGVTNEGRLAIIYIVSGEVTEYASSCKVPIVHKAGEVALETHVTSHWWRNTSGTTAVLLSADLLHDETDEHMM